MDIIENLQHAIVGKFSYGWPELEELRTLHPKLRQEPVIYMDIKERKEEHGPIGKGKTTGQDKKKSHRASEGGNHNTGSFPRRLTSGKIVGRPEDWNLVKGTRDGKNKQQKQGDLNGGGHNKKLDTEEEGNQRTVSTQNSFDSLGNMKNDEGQQEVEMKIAEEEMEVEDNSVEETK
ncbi:hypothetical protein HAX54_048512 [Datura stramonium]|uniref:Uncharacterized protein n=1 Tax=Datura stramonium TaxID=4076 RepID=A0ABS8WJC5_DATST|nr:hypothetical protein [Datura stramonium]